MVLLQSVITFFFMERHWALVTDRLSIVLTQDIAAVIDIYQQLPAGPRARHADAHRLERMKIDIEFLPKRPLPPTLPKPFFSIVDDALSNEIRKQIGRPFWLDTVGRSNLIEIRIQLDRRDPARRGLPQRGLCVELLHLHPLDARHLVRAASSSPIAFLRNQIRPILRSRARPRTFGKGREVEFRPRGAREVRQAGYAFIEMKRRLERAIEQRTAMLNGVSHDLRTVLTRFKLSLALMRRQRGFRRDEEGRRRDAAHARGLSRLCARRCRRAGDPGRHARLARRDPRRCGRARRADAGRVHRRPRRAVRPDAFKRCIANLVGNAQRHGSTVAIEACATGAS